MRRKQDSDDRNYYGQIIYVIIFKFILINMFIWTLGFLFCMHASSNWMLNMSNDLDYVLLRSLSLLPSRILSFLNKQSHQFLETLANSMQCAFVFVQPNKITPYIHSCRNTHTTPFEWKFSMLITIKSPDRTVCACMRVHTCTFFHLNFLWYFISQIWHMWKWYSTKMTTAPRILWLLIALHHSPCVPLCVCMCVCVHDEEKNEWIRIE